MSYRAISRQSTPTLKPIGKLSACTTSNSLLWPLSDDTTWTRIEPAKVARSINRGISPVTGLQMDEETKKDFMTTLKRIWPDWFKNVILTGLLQSHQLALKLLDESTMKKLGSGRFGTVYESELIGVPVAIKKVPRSKNDKGNDSGHSECYLLNTMRESLLIPRKTSGVIWMHQYLPGKDYDMAVLERAKESLWAKLVKGPIDLEYIKSVVFQVLHTLAVIHEEFPSFRHNDLKVDNVLLTDTIPTIVYESPDGDFIQLTQRVTAKIADFDFACASFMTNPKVGTSFSLKFGCDSTQNHFYDAHIFLNSLYRHVDTLPREMIDWIKRMVPRSLLGDTNKYLSYGRLAQPMKHATKLKTAKDLAWDSFLRPL